MTRPYQPLRDLLAVLALAPLVTVIALHYNTKDWLDSRKGR